MSDTRHAVPPPPAEPAEVHLVVCAVCGHRVHPARGNDVEAAGQAVAEMIRALGEPPSTHAVELRAGDAEDYARALFTPTIPTP